jgi:D-alanyl-D-alanine carboxypeptidase (penicillin-binding protein 5/6)
VVRRRRLTVSAIAVVVVVLAVLRVGAPLPRPTVHLRMPALTSSGAAPSLPWPAGVPAAVAVPSAGVLVTSGPEPPVPVASLTKIMTAYVVLRDHPLAPGASGPTITMTAADVADTAADEARNDTSVPVVAGEHLSERQLLDGLMVHSANNFADTLARWDAGSVAAFVARMNAVAASLGMHHTHYVDANGISHGSVSTARDQLILTERAMSVPAFAAIVDQPAVTLPLGGTLPNYVSAVGTGGVVGVKSGFTQAALGCLVLAADRQVDGRTVLVLAAVTGQGGYDALGQAQQDDLALVDAAAGALSVRTELASDTVVGHVTAPWTGRALSLRTVAPVDAVVWPGLAPTASVSVHLPDRLVQGASVGSLTVVQGATRHTVGLRLGGTLPPAGVVWRLLR